MSDEQGGRYGMRIIVLKIAVILMFIVYAARLFGMQVTRGDIYRERAHNIARQTMPILSQRGEIYDRNFDIPLVVNVDSFAVNVTPAEVPRGGMQDLIGRLAAVLNMNPDEISRNLPPSIFHLYQPVEIASNIPYSAIAAIAEYADVFPGVRWQSKPVRHYLEIESLSHIIGHVGNITRDELIMLYNRGYQSGDVVGKTGIERQYDELLRGISGRETRTVDVRGRIVAGDSDRVPPEMGRNLVLTVDRRIQTLAEKALGNRIGSAVVLRPGTGEILAMVSSPWYDPNVFVRRDLNAEFQAFANNPARPFLNRAIQSSYPPASTFKIPMTTALLAENSFPPERTVFCGGEISFGGRSWRCHVGPPGHGWVNLRTALAESCNIYFWTLGRDNLGADNIAKYSKDFGFGEVSGIDIPGEVAGLIPTPQWKERRFNERWVAGDTMNISIGQGDMSVTPLQMADMVAMAVNDGIIYKPYLLKEIRDPISGEIQSVTTPEVFHRSDINPRVFAALRQNMRSVITNGTVRFPMTTLDARTVRIAGKTGTGEAGFQDRWHSWFASYGPYETDDPNERIVVVVIVEAANDWEWWAPFASAVIYQGVFANQTFEEAIRTLGFPEHRLRTPRVE